MPTTPVHLSMSCPAKVNLALSIGSPNAQGLHPLASWMVATTFADTLTLRRSTRTDREAPFFLTRQWAEDAPRPTPIDWPVEADLAYRAWLLICQSVGQRLAVEATLSKRIPAGAGLGGGSSNAAAMLVGLDSLFDLQLDDELTRLANQLGSDVPFLVRAIRGQPSAIVSGLGERITPVADSPLLDLVLILPAIQCSTGTIYAAWDQTAGPNQPVDEPRINRLANTTTPQNHHLFNDLAPAAARVHSEVGKMLSGLGDLLNQPVHLTGSGGAMFTLCQDQTHAQRLVEKIENQANLPAMATRSAESLGHGPW